MCSLDRLHVEVESTGIWVRTDGRISTIGQGTTLSVAETGDIVFVAAEILLLRSSSAVSLRNEHGGVCILDLEGAMVLIDNLPHNLV